MCVFGCNVKTSGGHEPSASIAPHLAVLDSLTKLGALHLAELAGK